MRMKNGKKQRLWQKIVRVKGGQVVIDLPVNTDTMMKELQQLEDLLNKVYAPEKFETDYHWENVDE